MCSNRYQRHKLRCWQVFAKDQGLPDPFYQQPLKRVVLLYGAVRTVLTERYNPHNSNHWKCTSPKVVSMSSSPKKNRIASLRASLLAWLPQANASTGRRLDLQMLEERVLYSATPLPIDPDSSAIDSSATIDAQLDHMDTALIAA